MCTEQSNTTWTRPQDEAGQDNVKVEIEDPEDDVDAKGQHNIPQTKMRQAGSHRNDQGKVAMEIVNTEIGTNLGQQPNNPQIKMRQAGRHRINEEDLEDYPRHAPRVLMHWVDVVWKDQRELWTHWTIDNFDSVDSYAEHQLTTPIEFIKDVEIKANNFHQLRAHLLQVEAQLDGVEEKDEDEQQMMKWNVYNQLREMLMERYQPMLIPEHPTVDEELETEMDRMREDQENDEGRPRRMWMHHGQGYHVKEWSDSKMMINCMWKRNNVRKERDEEEVDDGDTENLVCTMRGNDWESLLYLIIVDSGASASTFPKDWCPHVKLWETEESRAGQIFNAANGQAIPNLGRRAVTLMTREGAIRDMSFEVCNVTRAFGSVSQICRAGHKVAFNFPWDQSGSCIEHIETGQKMWLTEKDGIYLLDVRVAPENMQTANNPDFTGQGP